MLTTGLSLSSDYTKSLKWNSGHLK